ncbi:hypothetical protein ATO6_21660 [Oceanicola sp. 22II-s10i]|uniref:DUF1223 domain-containing protein n=1 Tax=Oceanicola sp. 22II-s10i TaxID=1317116 RepID=UPI000B52372A|nr:DUF1223 domain-containing protein [Oceanicola sp. 22II-s10i]OWU82907.1 hypothetical protein ATO6_21660 [Oceanicola sp. 22II-s10i]
MITNLTGWVRGAVVALAFGTGVAGTAAAQSSNPVVVELYTSQGCSSCPPADAFFATLAERDDVIALALHVDYWDYIGWKDVFGNAQFSKRQKSYARHAGRRSVYTPQMIVQGQDDVVGTHPMDLTELVMRHRDRPAGIALTLTRANAEEVAIRAQANPNVKPPLVVQLVRYRPSANVEVLRGENAGRTLAYSNIVTEWKVLGEWNPAEPLDLMAAAPGDTPVVVLVQRPGPGAIEAAARLR